MLVTSLPFITGPQDAGVAQLLENQLIQTLQGGAGLLSSAVTAAGTGADTTEDILQSYTLPGGFLAAAGQGLRIRAWGVTGATANNKTMKLYFGASVITTPTAATNAKGWELELSVYRTTSAANQIVAGRGMVDTTPVTGYNNAGTDNTAAAVTIKCTGTNGTAAANDIVCNGMIIEIIK